MITKFTLRFAALISVVSCVQSNRTDIEEGKLLANFSLGSFLPPVSKITLPKLPAIPKRNTITLTTTVLEQKTRHVVVRPTCVKLHNVHSVCDGYLETVPPLPIIPTAVPWSNTDSDYDQDMTERRSISPSSTQPVQSTSTLDWSRKNIIEPSEFEYEYTAPDDVTPSIDADSDLHLRTNFLDTLLGPKYEIVQEHLTLTKVVRYTDLAHTATIVAINCFPPQLRYPICGIPQYHGLHRDQTKTPSEAADQVVNKVYNHVDEFVLNNPYGLLGISPEDTANQAYGALNSDAIPSIMRTAEQFPIRRSTRSKNPIH